MDFLRNETFRFLSEKFNRNLPRVFQVTVRSNKYPSMPFRYLKYFPVFSHSCRNILRRCNSVAKATPRKQLTKVANSETLKVRSLPPRGATRNQGAPVVATISPSRRHIQPRLWSTWRRRGLPHSEPVGARAAWVYRRRQDER